MDKRDLKILKAIADIGDPSPKLIEDETGIPKSTIHYRLGNLQEQGIIKNNLFEIDTEKLGLVTKVITAVDAEYEKDYHRQVGKELAKINGVSEVDFTMGDTDFIVVAYLTDNSEVERLIADYEEIPQIQRTSSMFVITSIKDESNPLRAYDLETLYDLFADDEE